METFQIGNWNSDKVKLHLPYLQGDKFTILQDTDANCHKLGLDFDIVLETLTQVMHQMTKDVQVGKQVVTLNVF